jgi:molecular chaperone DnaK
MAENGWTLAIDFGTSYTVAATAGPERAEPVYFGAGREPVMPSGVLAEPDGSLMTGTMAVNARRLDPERYVGTPKRLLGAGLRTIPLSDGALSVTRIVSAVLAEAAAQAGQQRDGTVPARTVLTHPAGWDPDLQRVLATAAQEAGLARLRVLAEPVAAALHLGRQCRPGDHIAVYDLGGGTFDVAVLRRTAGGFEVEATEGETTIGGEWFDELLQQHLDAGPLGQLEAWRRLSGPAPDEDTASGAYTVWRDQVDLLKDNIRFTKEVLSQRKSWKMGIPGYPEGWTVTCETLEDVLREPLTRTVDLLAATIADAGLTADQLSAIYLVGGASRTPMVKELLAERFPGKVISRRDDPQTVVALGAAGGYDDAIDIDQIGKKKLEEPLLVPWQSRLALKPTGSGTAVSLDRYEASARPRFELIARRKKVNETFGAFVQALEQKERQAGAEMMAQPTAIRLLGATLGLTQQGSVKAREGHTTITYAYAEAPALLVNTWANNAVPPAAAVESLSVYFRTVDSDDQLGLGMSVPAWVVQGMREHLVVRVKSRINKCVLSATTGPRPAGADTPEEVAGHLLAEMKRIYPRLATRPAEPDVFLDSRLCVHQLVFMGQPVRREHWWIGIVSDRFVRITVSGLSRRPAERYRDLVSLR